MNACEKAMEVMNELFAKDYQFSMATVKDNVPSVRVVDTFYEDGSFYVVTYSKTQKVRELKNNSLVALCNEFYRFSGNGYNTGHPLLTENKEIREKLIKVFEPWYFAHNNENDEDMCYVRIELNEGFFYKDGVGYKVNFKKKESEQFPFDIDIVPVS
ncbi:pyridoxamine 5'-phosphate oxidase family protein [Tissierella sp. MB52-C2]|uniref:pyridoxamine 5'-phosphate oxidase family protein n=1 Tax=Tissierella sp. MB52-C2 TaxID=3070999 RepID=UPI00280AF580|nr:pyridoxamine 5'-phosphate oxidase family protein [Tissierella sp. MB52-C2]WMM23974.1 pyridoxamine 5'-phosphate oxidase family protein [Tissierella sp. MB52-C2]